jgi:hypothetical protein
LSPSSGFRAREKSATLNALALVAEDLTFWLREVAKMPDLKPIMVAVTSVEAREGGGGTVMVRFTNPYADADFYIRVPVKNLNTQNILKEAGTSVKNFADQFALAASAPLQFSQ